MPRAGRPSRATERYVTAKGKIGGSVRETDPLLYRLSFKVTPPAHPLRRPGFVSVFVVVMILWVIRTLQRLLSKKIKS